MTIGELRAQLAEMPAGGKIGITNEVYAKLFPPGKPNVNAQMHCADFARVHGCRVENGLNDSEVLFLKESGGSA